jgi:hypothetical protein
LLGGGAGLGGHLRKVRFLLGGEMYFHRLQDNGEALLPASSKLDPLWKLGGGALLEGWADAPTRRGAIRNFEPIGFHKCHFPNGCIHHIMGS